MEQGQENRRDYLGLRGHTGFYRHRGCKGFDRINRTVKIEYDLGLRGQTGLRTR
jgi:hypothetical protein